VKVSAVGAGDGFRTGVIGDVERLGHPERAGSRSRSASGAPVTEYKCPYPERYAPQQKAERDAAERAATEKMSPTQRKRQELMKAPDGIYSKDPAKQKAAMAELRKLLANDAEDPGRLNAVLVNEQGVDPSEWSEALRSRFGIERPELYSVARGQDFDLHEGNALAYLAREGVAAGTVREIYRELHDRSTTGPACSQTRTWRGPKRSTCRRPEPRQGRELIGGPLWEH
jgi:hypothetical protein